MKKLLTVTLLVVMVAMSFATVANATTNSTLADELYAIASKYGMSSADKVRIERYLNDNPATDAQADEVIAKAKDAVEVMEKAGVTNYNDLTDEQKAEVKAKAAEAANVVGLELQFDGKTVKVVKDGKVIDTITNNDGKLTYTGNNAIVLSVVSVAIIALAAVVVAKKRLA